MIWERKNKRKRRTGAKEIKFTKKRREEKKGREREKKRTEAQIFRSNGKIPTDGKRQKWLETGAPVSCT